jgi:hypothetical protein
LSGEQVSSGSLVRVGCGSPEEFQGNEPQKRSPWRIRNRTTPMTERSEGEKAESDLRVHGGGVYEVFAIHESRGPAIKPLHYSTSTVGSGLLS